jgi:hypothetical protein
VAMMIMVILIIIPLEYITETGLLYWFRLCHAYKKRIPQWPYGV